VLELILDGEHVDADVARIAFASAPGRIALVTDAMAAAGAGDGAHRIGRLRVDVRGGVARLEGTETLAGSTLTLDAALRRAVEAVGLEIEAAVGAVTATPARVLGAEGALGTLAVGRAADVVLLDDALQVRAVWAAGEPVVTA
jgi:N-acetylglucosamine-6-phosphate deacetylase